MKNRLAWAHQEQARLSANLLHLNPQSILQRGYSITRDVQGCIVRDSAALAIGSTVELTFAVGAAQAAITAKK